MFIKQCRNRCAEGDVSCRNSCNEAYKGWFDVGFFIFGMLAEYMGGQGKNMLQYKACYSTNDCEGFASPPED